MANILIGFSYIFRIFNGYSYPYTVGGVVGIPRREEVLQNVCA